MQEWIEPDFLAISKDTAKYSARMGITKLAYIQSGQQERVGNLLSMNGNVEWPKRGIVRNERRTTTTNEKTGRPRIAEEMKKKPLSFTCPPKYYGILCNNTTEKLNLILQIVFGNAMLADQYLVELQNLEKGVDSEDENRAEHNPS